VWTNLIEHETGWIHKKNGKIIRSKKGALGVGQIMPSGALAEYNKVHQKKYTPKDLHNYYINLKISRWYFFHYLYNEFQGEIIKMVNSYNMGPGGTLEYKYNFTYLKDIIPIEFSYWIRTQNVIRFYDNVWIIEKKP
jgi:soluble lytic murein transglycosylase-like protein